MAQSKPKIVFWKPGGVVKGTQVYLDANFLVALAWPAHIWHTQATNLCSSFKERQTALILSSLALNEAIYQLPRLIEKAAPEVQLNWNETLSQTLTELPNLRSFEPPNLAFHQAVIRGVHDLHLDPTDAFHYAAARELNCPIVTNDAGFQKIPDQNLTVVTFF